MQIVNVVQGEELWHQARAKYPRTASRASAMMGCSKYTTRNQLLREMATGITLEVDAATQRRFDEGHSIEELARQLAEKVIGKKLYPITAVSDDEYLLASYDGLSADDSDAWECKSWNEQKAKNVRDGIVPNEDFWQVVQQLAIGAKRCLYMVTDGTEERTEYCWLLREEVDDEIARLLAGWEQFEKDLANYQHVEPIEKPKGETIMDLPALSVSATGMVTYSNLPEFKEAAESYISGINTDLATDQDFANAEATVKFCKTTEEKLEVTKSAILAQTATIDEVIRTVDHIQAQLREKRLMLDKLVKSEKEARKTAMVCKTGDKYAAHCTALQAEINGVQFVPLLPSQDFGAAIKGLKSLQSMQDALDTALANGKIEADRVAKDVRAKLAWYKERITFGNPAIFHDLQQLICKPMEDFQLAVSARLQEEAKREEVKLETERARIAAEEKAKAEAAALAELAASQARIREEEGVMAIQDATPAVQQDAGAAVIEHQDEIGAFMRSRDFGKDANRVRAILVEFVKFQAASQKK